MLMAHEPESYITYIFIVFSIGWINADGPIRNTNYGQVRGLFYKGENEESRAELYLGIPYARPPIDDLRFKISEPPDSWEGVRIAQSNPPWCIQFWYANMGLQKRDQDEDCLYLNVMVPYSERNESFPVLVWIHGGSYQVGGMGTFPTGGLVKSIVSKGVVIVLLNYRLGPLGFMSLMNKDLPGNFGLWDQLLALRWIKENIKYFQGNENKITVGGESAGGSSVSLLAVSEMTKGLFQQMMIRSASSLAPWALRSRNTDLNSHTVVHIVGCHADPLSGALLQSDAMMDCLRYNATVKKLLDAWTVIALDDVKTITVEGHKSMHYNHPFYAHTYFTPVVDGYMGTNLSLVPTYPEKAIAEHAHVPLLIGATTAECMGYITWIISGAQVPFEDQLNHVIPANLYRNAEQIKQAVYQQYFSSSRGSGKNSDLDVLRSHKILVEVASDQNFMAPVMHEAALYRQRGVPVHVYQFHHWNDQLAGQFREYGIQTMFGSPHGFDMVFLLKSTAVLDGSDWNIEFDDMDVAVAEETSKSIVKFVQTGSPPWHNFSDCDYVHVISVNSSLHAQTSVEDNRNARERFTFWNTIVPLVDSLTLRSGFQFTPSVIECPPDEGVGELEGNHCGQMSNFYKSGFYIAVVCAIIFMLATFALTFIHCSTKHIVAV